MLLEKVNIHRSLNRHTIVGRKLQGYESVLSKEIFTMVKAVHNLHIQKQKMCYVSDDLEKVFYKTKNYQRGMELRTKHRNEWISELMRTGGVY